MLFLQKKGRRLLTEKGSINYAKNAENHIHSEMELLGWENEGEWFKVPKGKLVDLVQFMIEHHYGNNEVSADGGGGKVYLLETTTITKIEREEINPEEQSILRELIKRKVKTENF